MVRNGSPKAASGRVVPEGYGACPVDVAVTIVGKKWTVLVIRNMLKGQRHFNEFIANIPGINPKTLSARLKELEREKIVAKRVSRSTPVTIEYELTDKGYAILPILRQMVRWSLTWAPDRIFGASKAPKDVERCMQEWQTTVMAEDPNVVLDWKPEVVTVRHAAKRRT